MTDGPPLRLSDRRVNKYNNKSGYMLATSIPLKSGETFSQVIDVKIFDSKKSEAPVITEVGKNHNAFQIDSEKQLSQVEESIKKQFGKSAQFTWQEYDKLLNELTNTRYLVVQEKDYESTNAPEKIVVCMRHDIDANPFSALIMAEMESKKGIHSTYFILTTALYYGELTSSGVKRYACMDQVYKKLMSFGHEIGVHNDLISLMLIADIDPMEFQKKEIEYYTSVGIPIIGAASHGVTLVTGKGLNNTWVYSEFKKPVLFEFKGKSYNLGNISLADVGFKYEDYLFRYSQRTSDVGGRFTSSIKSAQNYVEFFQACKPGDRVGILTHPVWWGK